MTDVVEQPLRSTDPDEVVARIAELATDRPWLTGIAVTLGGVVRDGVVVDAGFRDREDVPLAASVTGATALPVAVDNGVRASTSAKRVSAEAGYAPGVLIGHVVDSLDPAKILLTGDGLPSYELASGRVTTAPRTPTGTTPP